MMEPSNDWSRLGVPYSRIKLADLETIRHHMAEMIGDIEKDCGIALENPENGYPSSGTRNVCACVGNRLCRFANVDTTSLVQKIEKAISKRKSELYYSKLMKRYKGGGITGS